MRPGAISILFLCVVLSLAWTRTGECRWQTWQTRDGLGSGATFSVLEDRNGALWFGTIGGLSRYDGVSWRTFTNADGLAGPSAISTLEDRNGALWIATPGGVSRYDGVSWRTFTTADGLAQDYASCMLEDRSGALWFGTSAGVSRYDGTSWRTLTTADGLVHDAVNCMLEDRNGALWFGTDGGVSRYDGAGWRTFTTADGLAHDAVEAMLEERNGTLWFGTAYSGVSRYDGAGWSTFTTADGLADNSIASMLEDRNGVLWFATPYGVSRYDGLGWRTLTTADGLADNLVWSMLVDRSGALWFGTSGGVSRYDGVDWRTFTTADGLADNSVYSALAGRNGVLWVGTRGGVSRYDGVSWRTFTTADGLAYNSVSAILEDRAGAMWFGTGGYGVSRYDGASWRTFTTADGLADSMVFSMLEDRNGALWFGTANGVSRYDGVGWRTFSKAEGLADSMVLSMLEDRNGALWFGTVYSGVSRYDGVSWRNFTTADGLATRSVSSMLEDRAGVLWFGTRYGLRWYDGVSWRTFVDFDGLASNNVRSILEDRYGALWVGTDRGITVHAPDRVAPRTVFLVRPPAASANRVPSIGYVPAFDDQNIRFQYSLNQGLWSDWSPIGAWTSTALPDGQYDFRVRAQDDCGNVEALPESLEFEIDATPPLPSLVFPGANAAVRDSGAIRGTAADARFAYYRLEYRRRGAAGWTTLADTTRMPVTDGVVGGWKTRGLPDGKYELRLSVADTLGLTGAAIVPVSVDNQFPYVAQTSPALVTAAAGGDVYTDDAAAHLYLPPHGLSRDTIVTVTALDSVAVPASLPDGAVRVSAGYELGWGTVALVKAATLEMALPAEGAVVVYTEGADSVWHRVGGTVDASTKRITVPVSEPGRYALYREGGAPAPLGVARLSGITLTPRVFSPRGTFAATSLAIGFSLGRAGAVTVKVYNRAGRLVREVATGLSLGAGTNVVRWDGRDEDGRAAEDGAYLVTIGAFGETQTRALAVVR